MQTASDGEISVTVEESQGSVQNVVEAPASTGVTLLALGDPPIDKTGRTKLMIPAGIHAGPEKEMIHRPALRRHRDRASRGPPPPPT